MQTVTILVDNTDNKLIKDSLKLEKEHFNQDSITWVQGETEFI